MTAGSTPLEHAFSGLPEPRVDQDRMRRGPTADDLRELPATSAADWADAEVVRLVDGRLFDKFLQMIDSGQLSLDDDEPRRIVRR